MKFSGKASCNSCHKGGVYCIFMKIEENTFNVIPQHRGIWYSEVSLQSCPQCNCRFQQNRASLHLPGLLSENSFLCSDTDGGKKTRWGGTSAVTFLFVLILVVFFLPVTLVLVVRPVLHLLLVLLQLEHRVEKGVASVTAPMPLSCLRTVFVNSFPLSRSQEAPSPDAFPVAEESQRSDRRRYTLTLPRLKNVQLR